MLTAGERGFFARRVTALSARSARFCSRKGLSLLVASFAGLECKQTPTDNSTFVRRPKFAVAGLVKVNTAVVARKGVVNNDKSRRSQQA